jgi:hypothetical protein
MLVVPALERIGDASVFADDSDSTAFYVVPDRPRVARDGQGAPAIALTLYSPSDAMRSQAGVGDAMLQVDVDLSMADDARAAIAAALQPAADAANARRHAPAAPVKLVQPPWSRCAAHLVVGGPGGLRDIGDPGASILTGALARFSAPLGADDGVLLKGLFEAPTGGGLGATLDLSFFGRLPAVAVDVEADPGAIYDLLRGAADASGSAGCSQADLDALSSRGMNAQALADSGVVHVRVDPGSSEVGAETVTALRHYALDRLTALVQGRFFVTFVGPGGTPRFRLRPRADVVGGPLALTFSGADVVEWSVAPQTSNVLQGLTAADLAPRVRTIALGDPFWDTLALRVTAYADFGTTPIAFLQVDIAYDGGDATRPAFTASLVFEANGVTRTLPEPPPLLGGVRTYRYQTKIAYTGHDARVVSPWTTTDRFDLDVWAVDPAKLDVTVLAGDVDFTVVRSVVATVAFDDPAGQPVEHPLTLTADVGSASLVRVLEAPLAKPARVTPTFYLADGTTMAGDAVDVVGSIVAVGLPAARTLRVSVLLSGDLTDVSQVLVELTYDDGNGYSTTADRRLASLDDLQRWTVPLRDASKADFQYSVEIDYHHRAPEIRASSIATGSQAIAVAIAAPPALNVVVHPELVDFGAVPLVSVDLAHDGAAPARASLPFSSPTPQTWRAPLSPGDAPSFTYAITYHPVGRDPVALAPIASSASAVVIPTYDPPAPGTLTIRVLGSSVDFGAVRSVQVDVRLPGDTTTRASATLTAVEPSATLRMPVPPGFAGGYLVDTTFTPVAGALIALPESTTDIPLLVPRLP